MDEVSLNILLEFLYNKFAVTFLLCLVGSLIRETTVSTKNKSTLNITKMVASTVFSTFLMCACADYMNKSIPFSIYACICIFLGMWGYKIIKIALDGKFFATLLKSLLKSTDPIIKSVASAASEAKDEDDSTSDNDDDKNTKEENKNSDTT